MAKEYVIEGRKVKGWYTRGGARIPIFEDGSIGKNQNKKNKEFHYAGEELYSDDPNRFGDKMRKYNEKMNPTNSEYANGRKAVKTPTQRAKEIDKINKNIEKKIDYIAKNLHKEGISLEDSYKYASKWFFKKQNKK